MPKISRFFGIIIRMFMEAGVAHHTPHFHAYYQEHVGVFSIDPVELIAGDLPRVQGGLWRRGRSFTALSFTRIGSGCSRASPRSRLRRYNMVMSSHPIHRVTAFERVGVHVLRVEFADGSRQIIDFTPVLVGEVYGPLQDPDFFGRVRLDPEVDTLVWPNGADFDPATLHDWPLLIDELKQRARAWGSLSPAR